MSKKVRLCVAICSAVAVCSLLSWHRPAPDPVPRVSDYYTRCLTDVDAAVRLLETELPTAPPERLKELFAQARRRYKKVEWLVEYLYPVTALKLNGPALPEAEPAEPEEVLQPTGFQVLEEKVYAAAVDEALRREMVFDLGTVTNRVRYLQSQLAEAELNESLILDALKLNLYRLIAKGITGFDTPVSLTAVSEIEPTLQSTEAVLAFFPATEKLRQRLQRAIRFAQRSPAGFNGFDRAAFLTQYLNPVCAALAQYQRLQRIPPVKALRAIRSSVATLFDRDAFDPLFYAPSGTAKATPQQLALGKALFAEPLLSSTGNRSCITCHQPGNAFSDGLPVNSVLTGEGSLQRNTPGLWNAGLQPVQFYDSRITFLEDQVHDVVSSRQEMGGLFDGIVIALNAKEAYRKSFKAAYSGNRITADNVRSALAAYVRSLVALNSPFDRYMRGQKTAMTKEQVAGFNLFAGKAKCATCHFLPLLSGTVPPLYNKMESEVLGVPTTADTSHPVLDNDPGKYEVYTIPHHLRSFKTPSLRNAALTAPYMHNGVYKTLEEVVDFYNRGGGAGLGFDLSNQTLPADRLDLNDVEKKRLVSFLHALTDTGGKASPKRRR